MASRKTCPTISVAYLRAKPHCHSLQRAFISESSVVWCVFLVDKGPVFFMDKGSSRLRFPFSDIRVHRGPVDFKFCRCVPIFWTPVGGGNQQRGIPIRQRSISPDRRRLPQSAPAAHPHAKLGRVD